mgnify:CR=1 FL=1
MDQSFSGRGRCLVCGSRYGLEDAHFPYGIGMGRRRRNVHLPTVTLCIYCHRLEHLNDPITIDILLRRAPDYWREREEWEFARPYLERYLARRKYLEAVIG